MKYITNIEDDVLNDMLIAYTSRKKQLEEEGKTTTPEYSNCLNMILQINAELKRRKTISGKSD